MARWPANPKERLARAALELFAERGYDATTVADLVARAGLTKSTFFRHFTDKREVLFIGQAELVDLLTDAVTQAPPDATPREYLAVLTRALTGYFDTDALALAATRAQVVSAHPELRERDLLKRAQLEVAAAAALGARGIDAVGARLVATLTLWSFDTALERWAAGPGTEAFPDLVAEAVESLVQQTHRAILATRG